MTRIFAGIDFAIHEDNEGTCWLEDDGEVLRLGLGEPPSPAERTAIDSPLGTSYGFSAILRGCVPNDVGGDGYLSRQTERWLRGTIKGYATTRAASRGTTRLARHRKVAYFRETGHVQPTVRMFTVPKALAWLLNRLDLKTPAERLQALVDARTGLGPIIEAHPRPFLYSAFERLGVRPNGRLSRHLLRDVALYKYEDQESARRGRELALMVLCLRNEWQGLPRPLRLELPADVRTRLVSSHHSFDAFLAALTAWAHSRGQTVGYREAGIPQEVVEEEGHILVLSNLNGVRA